MAKEKVKDPALMTIEEKLKNLYKLQTTLSEIDELKTLRGELPQEVEDLEDEIEGLRTRIDRIQDELSDLRREIADRTAVIEESKIRIQRYEEQKNNVRNNREYDALTKEIEILELDIQLNDKKIREANDHSRHKTEEAMRYNQLVAERRADLETKKGELDEIIAETKEQEDHKREEAKRLECTIEQRLLNAFKRIRKNSRNGLGIVYVQRDACGGCFNKIPPQRQLDVRMYKKIIVCEYCGRILIDPQLAGVRLETEEKPKRKRTTRSRKTAE